MASVYSFRNHLQDVLVDRCRKNPGYSLRSFARSLQISPSSLSRILRGERQVSSAIGSRLGLQLGLSPTQLANFKWPISREPSAPSKADFQALPLDAFAAISDWYHFAILELVRTKGFRSEASWVAKKLGITVSQVHAAVDRLFRLKLLKVDRDGVWTNIRGNNTNLSQDMRNAAYRSLQKQVLQMALDALDEIEIEKRDQSSMTMAISSKRLPEAIERITKFRREMSRFLEKDKNRDSVYQLSVSLYPLTKNVKGKNHADHR